MLKFLGALPDATAARLFAALEHDRARGGRGLPHDALLDDLRRRLQAQEAAFPKRPPTAKRRFFTPAEDLFVGHRAGRKRPARIARESINPIWDLVMSDPACAETARAAAALDQAYVEGARSTDGLEAAMFDAAARNIGRLAARAGQEPGLRADLIARLGGAGRFEDFAELGRILAAAGPIRALQETFPKPVAALTEEDVFEVRRLYAAARAADAGSAPYLLLVLTARMETPWRALSVYYHLARARDPALGDFADEAGVVIETLFDDLEVAARGLERDANGPFDADDAGLRLRHFADFAEGLAAEARAGEDMVTLNRVEACRDIAGEALARFAEQSLTALRRAMPVRHAGGASRLMALRPDYARPLPAQAVSAAREAAQFLAAAPGLARRLHRAPAAAGVVEDAVAETRRYLSDLVVEIRAAEGEDRAAARRHMETAVDIAAPLLPGDELGVLRERAHAAALSA
ncbi:hypothetical protein [Amphiplicatus metriothermophilus]|uniref:hypothetical protein n=1 Tax=Amphiplicatus metriothermophilus TaxID=1519374 RepID=UPI0011775AE2|nr:hypothetical protein [Amphiplicatus metriothermophilus]MBB5518809.1 hypothetical protein [Amphiplicatus metriothermophilus]